DVAGFVPSRKPTALRDFNPAFVRFGSSATEAAETTPRCMSASPQKRTNGRRFALSVAKSGLRHRNKQHEASPQLPIRKAPPHGAQWRAIRTAKDRFSIEGSVGDATLVIPHRCGANAQTMCVFAVHGGARKHPRRPAVHHDLRR